MNEEESEVTIDARRFAAVCANAVEVEAWADEVTMDFIRMDPVESRGMVVARRCEHLVETVVAQGRPSGNRAKPGITPTSFHPRRV